MSRSFWIPLALLLLAGCSDDGRLGTGNDGDCSDYLNTVSQYRVIETGQSQCFDQIGNVISCSELPGQDAQYAGTTPSYSLCDGQQVVVDNRTGLLWQKAHNTPPLSLSGAGLACENLSLGGFNDWRLPNIKELLTFASFAGSDLYLFSPFEIGDDSSDPDSGQTWSTTRYPGDSSQNYVFNFLNGQLAAIGNASSNERFYRCVRNSQVAASPSFEDTGNGTVRDLTTGLMWQQANARENLVADYQFTWQNALRHCENATTDGHLDWRLPNIKELQSLVHYGENDGLASVFTQETPSGAPYYWSSTTDEQAPAWAYYACFGGSCADGPGSLSSAPKYAGVAGSEQFDNYVRCVRTE